jgi:hypothetical protein
MLKRNFNKKTRVAINFMVYYGINEYFQIDLDTLPESLVELLTQDYKDSFLLGLNIYNYYKKYNILLDINLKELPPVISELLISKDNIQLMLKIKKENEK